MEASVAEALERASDLDIDPYDDAFIADPYPGYAAMRSAGPVFYMPKYRCWGMARYKEVRPALLDWKTYCSGMGVGYTHFGKEKPWRPPSLLLETDPPLHDRTRRIVDRVVFRQRCSACVRRSPRRPPRRSSAYSREAGSTA